MAKRRENRRATTESTRRSNRVEFSTHVDRTSNGDDSSSSRYLGRKLVIAFYLFFIVAPPISFYLYRTLYSPLSVPPPSYSTHFHRLGIVKENIDYHEILTEHSSVSENGTDRHFTYPILAYITPWNSKGYDIAKIFNHKFTHLSPVWYDLRSKGVNLVLEGRHNADVGWISELRKKGDTLLLPRVVLEVIPVEFFKKKKQRDKTIDLILTECKEMKYDGIVLESWSRWAGYGILHDPDMRKIALQFIRQLGEALHAVSSRRGDEQRLELVYVIGPPHSEQVQEYDFGPNDLRRLIGAVDGFSLMTYDFSSPQNPGPNAPLQWIRSTLQLLLGTSSNNAPNVARKIFLGMNFYGNDFMLSGGFGGGAITGRDYLSLLERHKPVMQWEKNSAEHFFIYSDNNGVNHAVFYPSVLSISTRLEEARSWGVGISIWEIGQGLDYFFDLL